MGPTAGGPGVLQGSLAMGAWLWSGVRGARTWVQMLVVVLLQPWGWDPRQPPALPAPSPCLQLGFCWTYSKFTVL